jgi:hypothetical protein
VLVLKPPKVLSFCELFLSAVDVLKPSKVFSFCELFLSVVAVLNPPKAEGDGWKEVLELVLSPNGDVPKPVGAENGLADREDEDDFCANSCCAAKVPDGALVSDFVKKRLDLPVFDPLFRSPKDLNAEADGVKLDACKVSFLDSFSGVLSD